MSVHEPVQILHPDGELADSNTWFPDPPTPLSSSPFVVVAITGPQASGKSTLANALFETDFPVADPRAVGLATTRGILGATPSLPPRPTFVLDVEGADARARGREAKLFASQTASFVASLADAVIVNLWYHDACRLDSAAYALLRSILFTSAHSLAEGAPTRTALIVAVRDADDDSEDVAESLHELITSDVADIWSDVALESGFPVGDGASALDEVIDLHICMLPHIRHQQGLFNERVTELRNGLYDGTILNVEHSKQIPADGFSTYALTLWDAVATAAVDTRGLTTNDSFERKQEDFYGGEDFAIVAGYRCDEAFSAKLAVASGEIADLLDEVEGGTRVDGLGQKCDSVVERTLQEYDVETTEFVDEPVYERKRKELEVILDTALNTVYMKNVAIVVREALATFKSAIAEEMPADFALYNADAKFVKQAKEGMRSGSAWSFDSERQDLQKMMQEIAAQQRKLMDTKVTASQQQSKAMQFLRMQHAQMQAVQQQAMGGAVGQWNVGAAYRPPDSNVNVSLGYQQGRTNLQVSMVPDESSSLLGPSGFTAGVGPGNLGLSFNVNF